MSAHGFVADILAIFGPTASGKSECRCGNR